jgi:hypothetical protein
MVIYRVEGHSGACVQLSDLVTNQRCSAICECGYTGGRRQRAYRQRTGTLAL